MADRYTLDTCDWPIILNDGDEIVATFPRPGNSNGDNDAAAREQIERANAIVRFLNNAELATRKVVSRA